MVKITDGSSLSKKNESSKQIFFKHDWRYVKWSRCNSITDLDAVTMNVYVKNDVKKLLNPHYNENINYL